LLCFSSREPLTSCRNCLGSVGKLFEHEYVDRKNWRQSQTRPTSELIDWQFLRWLEESDPHAAVLTLRGEAFDVHNRRLARLRA